MGAEYRTARSSGLPVQKAGDGVKPDERSRPDGAVTAGGVVGSLAPVADSGAILRGSRMKEGKQNRLDLDGHSLRNLLMP